MQILIDETEGYPIYTIKRGSDAIWFEKSMEIPEEQVIKWEQVIKEYVKVQQELRDLYRNN
jgi:hypothetical protein